MVAFNLIRKYNGLILFLFFNAKAIFSNAQVDHYKFIQVEYTYLKDIKADNKWYRSLPDQIIYYVMLDEKRDGANIQIRVLGSKTIINDFSYTTLGYVTPKPYYDKELHSYVLSDLMDRLTGEKLSFVVPSLSLSNIGEIGIMTKPTATTRKLIMYHFALSDKYRY